MVVRLCGSVGGMPALRLRTQRTSRGWAVCRVGVGVWDCGVLICDTPPDGELRRGAAGLCVCACGVCTYARVLVPPTNLYLYRFTYTYVHIYISWWHPEGSPCFKKSFKIRSWVPSPHMP